MTLNTRYLRTSLNATFLLIIFVSLLFNPIPSRALQNSELTLPDFTEFSKTVQNGEANVLRGVYVSGLLAFPIVQQPIDNANYVSSIDGELAQFGMAAQFGNVVLRHPSDDTFGRKLRKLHSILAGESSAKFSILLGDVAAFDCRISQLPQIGDVVDYFRWRSEDAHRNALNGHCYWMLRQ